MNLDLKKTVEQLLTDRAQDSARMLVQLILVLWLGASLAGLTWRLWPGPERALAPPPPQTSLPAGAPGGGGPGQRWDIARWHLFGTKPAGGDAARPAVADLPETQLNLTLRGVVASDMAGESGAIIASPNGIERFYGIDDALPGGATLTEVYGDRVVLERNGRLETLRLPRERLDQDERAAASRAPRSAGSAATLGEVRDMVIADPQRINDLVRIAPKNEGGRFIGYELQPGRDARLMSRLGLQPGDVVTAVNGVELDNPAKALSVLRTLAQADRVRVDLRRNGTPQSLVINLND